MPRLDELSIPEVLIETSGGNFSVRGLGTDDIGYLFRLYGPELNVLWQTLAKSLAQSEEDPLDDTGLSEALALLISQTPDIMADVIALGSGDRDQTPTAKRLPITVQFAAVKAIGELTFVGEDGLKQLAETIMLFAGSANGLKEALLSQVSGIGSDHSAGK